MQWLVAGDPQNRIKRIMATHLCSANTKLWLHVIATLGNIRGLELFNTIFKLWIKKSYKYQKVDNNEGESDTRMVWTW